MKKITSIFLEDNVDSIQNGITIAAGLLKGKLLDSRQKLLFKNWSARLIAFRLFFQNNFIHNSSFITPYFNLGFITRLYSSELVFPKTYFYVRKTKGINNFFCFPKIYNACFFNLCNMLILPVNENKSSMSSPCFRPYRSCYDVCFYIKKILNKKKIFNFYIELRCIKTLTHLNKFWLIKNFPISPSLSQRIFSENFSYSIFAVKNLVPIFMSSEQKPFEITVFNYILNDLL